MYKILTINPGSTSTKIAIYNDEKEVLSHEIAHTADELSKYSSIYDQYDMRYDAIVEVLEDNDVDFNALDIIVGRGGPVAPLNSGAYLADKNLCDRLLENPMIEHASNLAALIAYDMAEKLGIKALIYDAISTDEMQKLAKISGTKEIVRRSMVHTLNMRASALKYARENKLDYNKSNFIVAHLGGGLSLSLHSNGKMIDTVADDEGSFSPERSGVLPSGMLVDYCYQNTEADVNKMLRGHGGLISYLGTNDAREVEAMVEEGNKEAELIYKALAYQISKNIGELATVVCGDVDAIIISGGMAHSDMLTGWIKERVKFIGDVVIIPGENEMEALALGGLRVLREEEELQVFKD